MPRVKTNGTEIYYDEVGEGPPLIMLHAFPTDRTLWLFQTHAFSDFYRAITVDLRGFGKSGRQVPDEGITMKTMSDDVYGLLDALGIKGAYMMGLSMGSLVTMQFAIDHAERLRKIVLAGSYAHLTSKDILETFDNWISILEHRDLPSFLEAFFSQPVRTEVGKGVPFSPGFIRSKIGSYLIQDRKLKGARLDPQTLVEVIKGFKKFDLRRKLGRITTPTLVIAGERELISYMKEVHSLIPSSTLQIIHGSGHFSCLDNPEDFNRTVSEFLGKRR